MSKIALILGVNGQDGSYLADVLVDKGYEVFGVYRHSSHNNLWRFNDYTFSQITLLPCDITDSVQLAYLIQKISPDEIYNVADQDQVRWASYSPSTQCDITFKAVLNLLEIIRGCTSSPVLFQPVSAHIFAPSIYQNENTRPHPTNLYGVMKAAVYHLCRMYQEQHALKIQLGIMYNHDSPRRIGNYLLNTIARQAARIEAGLQTEIVLNSADDSEVDIGYARDYMEAVVNSMATRESTIFLASNSCRMTTLNTLISTALNGTYSTYAPRYDTNKLCAHPLSADLLKIDPTLNHKELIALIKDDERARLENPANRQRSLRH